MNHNCTEIAKSALSECRIINNKDGTINVIGNLKINFSLEYLPEIKILTGNFDCSENKVIKTLHGSPANVIGNFHCNNCNSLETLQGAPTYVKGDFYCNNCNSLKTLQGAPSTVSEKFCCAYCKSLETLQGAPLSVVDFNCAFCNKLETLQGAPMIIKKGFYHHHCKSLSPHEKPDWLKKEDIYKKRKTLETTKNNSNDTAWHN